MWIFSVLPDTVIHLILAVGIIGTVAGFLLGMVPLVKKYKLIIQVISLLILSFGLYLEGGLADNKIWEARVAEVKVKLAEAEAKSAKENVKIVERVVTKTQIVKERGADIVKYVDREVVKYDTKFLPGGICEIPKEFIKAHNDAAEPPKK
jgi:hypothetical protein